MRLTLRDQEIVKINNRNDIKFRIVNHSLALRLKQKGFKQKCEHHYGEKGEIGGDKIDCFAPSILLAVKWLEINYGIHLTTLPIINCLEIKGYKIVKDGRIFNIKEYKTAEDAYEATLYTLLNLIK